MLDDIDENNYAYLCYETEAFSLEDIESIQSLGVIEYSTDFATVIKLN